MRASLIVLNYEGRAVLPACINSLLASISADDEIIVVDNASTDSSADLVPLDPRVRVIRRDVNNFIFGLNDGLANSNAEFVAFLNNDIVVEPTFVELCLATFQFPDDFAVCPRILDRHGMEQGALTTGHWIRGLIFYKPLPHDPLATTTFFAVGGQSFFRRQLLVRLGSIDELFWPMYHEDIELSYRAWKAGYRIRFCPEAIVHHVGGHASKRTFTDAQLRSFVRQNEFLTVWKNITDPTLLGAHLCLLPLRLLTALFRRDWPTLVGFSAAIKRLPRVRVSRRAARSLAVLSDRAVLARVGQAPESAT